MPADGGKCENRQPGATSHSNGSCQPNDRGRRQTAHTVVAHKYQTTANEPDAGYDLSDHARWIDDNAAISQDIRKPIFSYLFHKRQKNR